MTTYYLSKNGNDGDGLTLATAKTLFRSIYSLANDDDTVLVDDGEYTPTEYESTLSSGVCALAKGLTINPINANAASFVGDGTASVVSITTADKDYNLDGMIIDGRGGNVTGVLAMTIGAGAAANVSLTNTKIYADGTSIACYQFANAERNLNITGTNTQVYCFGASSGFVLNLTGANASLILRSPLVSIVNATGNTKYGININCTVTTQNAALVRLYKPKVSYQSSAATATFRAIRIEDINDAWVYLSDISIQAASATNVTAGIIDASGATNTANNGRFIGCKAYINAASGYGFLIGHDATSAADDQANDGRISYCYVEGSDSFAAGAGHGVMSGWSTGTTVTCNKVKNTGIGVLLKGTTSCRSYGNIVKDYYSSGLYAKAGTNDEFSDNLTIQEAYVASVAAFRADVDGAANCSGVQSNSNIHFIDDGIDQPYINTTASQDVTFDGDVFLTVDGSTPATEASTVLGTSYATLALHGAANDASYAQIDLDSINHLIEFDPTRVISRSIIGPIAV